MSGAKMLDAIARMPGNSGENANLEWNSLSTALILVLLPDLFGQALLALRFSFWLKEFVVIHEIGSALVSSVELILWLLGGLRNA